MSVSATKLALVG